MTKVIQGPVPGLWKSMGAAAAVGTTGVRTWGMVVMAMTGPGARHWVHSEAALGLPGTTARAARLSCFIPIVGIGKNKLILRCEPFLCFSRSR